MNYVDFVRDGFIVGGERFEEPPLLKDFCKVLPLHEENIRSRLNAETGISVCVLDSSGIVVHCVGTDNRINLVKVCLEKPQWRPDVAWDPESLFSGEIRFFGRPIPRPMTLSLANLISSQRDFGNLRVDFTPNGGSIAAIRASFPPGARAGERGQ